MRSSVFPARFFANALVSGSRNFESSTTRTGEYEAIPGNRHVSIGSSGQHGADADQVSIALRAQHVNVFPRPLAGDHARACVRASRFFSIGRNTELERDMRTAIADAANVSRVRTLRFVRAKTNLYRDARRARNRTWPCPATSGLGSSNADTTRVMPAATIASTQGGVLP